MSSTLWSSAVGRRTGLVSACLIFVGFAQLCGAGKAPMKILKYDPNAEKVELFAGLESGALSVRVSAHDIKGGNLFIENRSGQPLTIELPAAIAMVHVLKQVGNNNGFFNQLQLGNGNQNGNGLLSQQGAQQGGQQGGGQSIGAGFGQQQGNTPGGGNGNGLNNPAGNGFFSIPPERVAHVPYQSVCLNYGKPDPSPRMTYKPVRLEEFTSDKVLQATLRLFGQGRLNHTAAQAACWHQTDNMSWEKLAALKEYTLPGVYTSQVPTFTAAELRMARDLVATAKQEAAKQAPAIAKSSPDASVVVKTGQ